MICLRYYIVDDDIASRKILSRIIVNEFLGEVIGEEEDAKEAEKEILELLPDIVLIDLLMPFQDGIETVQNLKRWNFSGKFIMISQVENKEMVAKAYNEGVDYFIHKPINLVEVSSVISKVKEQMVMEQSLNKIKESLAYIHQPNTPKKQSTVPDIQETVLQILGEIGIIGESGSNDLLIIMDYLYRKKNLEPNILDKNTLKEIYLQALSFKQDKSTDKEIKALEQRLRRTVNQAMINMASLGLTDYAHPKFEYYSTRFFDFNEIRLKMRELERENSSRLSKINLRKFIYALYQEIEVRGKM